MLTITQIAKTCHNVVSSYAKAIGETNQLSWDELPFNSKLIILKGIEFKLQNPSATPEEQHNFWCECKIKDGWTYGEILYNVKKTHPCLKPKSNYNELPLEQRIKDDLFQSVITSIIN